MVAGMAKTRGGTDDRAPLDAARATLLDVRGRLTSLVDRDASAYDAVAAAYRLPRNTPEEKERRTIAIQDALRVATEVPLEVMSACVTALEAGVTVARRGNPSAASDIGVGAELLLAATTGGRYNAEINLGGLKDPLIVERLSADVRDRMATATIRVTEIRDAFRRQ
jgi:glutamate formiminotransferase/formiminotetrahydrofolate cyclodeaminase